MLLACLTLFAPHAAIAAAKKLITAQPVKIIQGGDELGLRHPSDVLTTADNRILVLDGVSNRVVIYSANGEFIGAFGTGGKDQGELNAPLGMASDAQGRIYIADSGNARVQVYTPAGEYLSHIDLPHAEGEKRPDPVDVAVDDKRGFLYVLDNENHRVQVFGLEQKNLIGAVGKMTHNDDGFRWPFTLFVDEDGTVYVVDTINTIVKTLLPDKGWSFGGTIGRWGVESGEFFRPKGVAIDAAGHVYVSDSYFGIIQVFDRSGTFLGILGDGQQVRRFTTPTRLYVDRNGLLFVVEMFANRVSVFKIAS